MKNIVWLLLVPLLVGCAALPLNPCAEDEGVWNEATQVCDLFDKTPEAQVETELTSGISSEVGGVFEWNMIEQKTEAYELKYPEFTAGVGSLVEILNTDLASGTDSFVKQAEDWKAEGEANPELSSFAPWMLIIEPSYQFGDDTFISLRLDTYDYSGGAHGNAYYGVLNYHVPTATSIMLEDLFVDEDYLAFLSETIEPQIIEQKKERYESYDNDQEYVLEEDFTIKDGLKPEVSNFKIFQFEDGPDGRQLTFLFAPYQLGAYAEGSFVASIPAADLAEFVKPEYQAWFK